MKIQIPFICLLLCLPMLLFAQLEYRSEFLDNGFYKDGYKIKNKEVIHLFDDHPEAMNYYKKGKRNGLLSNMVGIIGLGLDIVYLTADEASLNRNNRDVLIIATGLVAVGGSIYFGLRKKQLYNKAIGIAHKAHYLESSIGYTKNGLGLIIRF